MDTIESVRHYVDLMLRPIDQNSHQPIEEMKAVLLDKETVRPHCKWLILMAQLLQKVIISMVYGMNEILQRDGKYSLDCSDELFN